MNEAQKQAQLLLDIYTELEENGSLSIDFMIDKFHLSEERVREILEERKQICFHEWEEVEMRGLDESYFICTKCKIRDDNK